MEGNKMKYLILIGDGMADLPLDELGGKTPLEAANTPNMDMLAGKGQCGLVQNVPEGMQPGSDVAIMSIFGYNPAAEYTGRGPLEAMAKGLRLLPDDLVYRCNLVVIEDGIMKDFTAGHIKTEEAAAFIRFVDKKLGSHRNRLIPGTSYRHLLIIKEGNDEVTTTPPHDITDQEVSKYLPKGRGSKIPKDLMSMSAKILKFSELNGKRIDKGQQPVSQLWLWGQGKKPDLQPLTETYDIEGAVITAVDLVKGLGKAAGMEIVEVPDVTGFLDTNYEGKVSYGLEALEDKDFLLVHVEAPDECGHMGDVTKKIKAIEDFDEKIVGGYLKGLEGQDFRMLVLPDHATPIVKKTHTGEPVPYVIFDSTKTLKHSAENYSEAGCKKTASDVLIGEDLMSLLIKEV
jgi:2,3-bisphosphoglycerate-independent phosphoglycerate mutase